MDKVILVAPASAAFLQFDNRDAPSPAFDIEAAHENEPRLAK